MFGKIVLPLAKVGGLLLWLVVTAIVVALGMAQVTRDKFNQMNTPKKPWWTWVAAVLIVGSAVGLTVCAWYEPALCHAMCWEILRGLAAAGLYSSAAILSGILAKQSVEERVDVLAVLKSTACKGLVGGYLLGVFLVGWNLIFGF